MNVWVVRHGNYEPAEIIAVYDNERAAQAHAAWENEGTDAAWTVELWSAESEFTANQMIER